MESTAAINRRRDERYWPEVQKLLLSGAKLVYHPKISMYYTDTVPAFGLTPTGIKNKVKSGELELVGVQTYGLTNFARLIA